MGEADKRVTTVVMQEFDPGTKIYVRKGKVEIKPSPEPDKWPKPVEEVYQLGMGLEHAKGQLSLHSHLPGDLARIVIEEVARDHVDSEG